MVYTALTIINLTVTNCALGGYHKLERQALHLEMHRTLLRALGCWSPIQPSQWSKSPQCLFSRNTWTSIFETLNFQLTFPFFPIVSNQDLSCQFVFVVTIDLCKHYGTCHTIVTPTDTITKAATIFDVSKICVLCTWFSTTLKDSQQKRQDLKKI